MEVIRADAPEHPARSSAAAIRLVYSETSGALTRLGFEGPRPPWLEKVHFQHHPGDELVLPADGGDMFTARIGYVNTTGPTADDAQARAEQALRSLLVHVAPRTAGAEDGSIPAA
jgi:hypothetical protein